MPTRYNDDDHYQERDRRRTGDRTTGNPGRAREPATRENPGRVREERQQQTRDTARPVEYARQAQPDNRDRDREREDDRFMQTGGPRFNPAVGIDMQQYSLPPGFQHPGMDPGMNMMAGNQLQREHDPALMRTALPPARTTREPDPTARFTSPPETYNMGEYYQSPPTAGRPTYYPEERGQFRESRQEEVIEPYAMEIDPKPKPNLKTYFVPGEGIHREVLQSEITKFLGADATSTPGDHKGQKGFKIRALRPFTSAMLRTLKEESARFLEDQERRRRLGRGPGEYSEMVRDRERDRDRDRDRDQGRDTRGDRDRPMYEDEMEVEGVYRGNQPGWPSYQGEPDLRGPPGVVRQTSNNPTMQVTYADQPGYTQNYTIATGPQAGQFPGLSTQPRTMQPGGRSTPPQTTMGQPAFAPQPLFPRPGVSATNLPASRPIDPRTGQPLDSPGGYQPPENRATRHGR